jgi:hypothetical protein
MFAFLGIFIHLEKYHGSHPPRPDQRTCHDKLPIQLGAVISVVETAPSGGRSIANYLLFA